MSYSKEDWRRREPAVTLVTKHQALAGKRFTLCATDEGAYRKAAQMRISQKCSCVSYPQQPQGSLYSIYYPYVACGMHSRHPDTTRLRDRLARWLRWADKHVAEAEDSKEAHRGYSGRRAEIAKLRRYNQMLEDTNELLREQKKACEKELSFIRKEISAHHNCHLHHCLEWDEIGRAHV